MKKFDSKNLSNEEKIVYGKFISAIIIVFIIMCYAISFAVDSVNYNAKSNDDAILNSDIIYNGVYIEETFVGGLTKEQAVDVATTSYDKSKLDNYDITVATDYGYSKTFTYRELGAEYDIENAVDEAYEVGRSGSRDSRVAELDEISARGEHIPPAYSINEKKLRETVDSIVTDVNKEYSLKGKSADADRTYDMIYKNLEIKERDLEIIIPEKTSNEE